MALKRIITWPFRYIKQTLRVLVMIFLAPILIMLDLILYLPYRMVVGGLFGEGAGKEIGAATDRWKGWVREVLRGLLKLVGVGE
ncbi:hypothetical protein HWV07_04315 [Natronomonas salina]|uniref:hypothetical protein n=1 Tax=Natronomonas salina TaxID=1710540 RepID=UPI0015B6B83D|nr:hypothetical protein [Natronomonas salina]QLD88298.1 hypothetical protein HWV07_04315 [Natronomonas salina]